MIPQYTADDRGARGIIRASLGESLIVEASAGTGKTTELVKRVIAVLRAGLATIEQIVAVTFTNKAAGELKIRLRQELDEARESAEGYELGNLEKALEGLEYAAIGTIHSFCAQALRERPVEAKIDPAFGEMTDVEQRGLYDRAFRGWFENALSDPGPGLRRALSRLAWTGSTDGASPTEQLRMAGWKLIEWRDFPAPWRREPFERIEEMRELARGAKALARLSDRARRQDDVLVEALRPAREFAAWIDRSRDRATPDYDAIESLLIKLARDSKRFKKTGRGAYSDDVTREQVIAQRDELVGQLESFKARADADLAAQLQEEMRGLVTRYEDVKRRAGKLDFNDLLIKVRELVRSDGGVRRYLQGRFTHFFIDEFQDTDPVQAETLLLLAADDPTEADWRKVTPKAGKLFVVGDPKQSIYKFRRADVMVYQETRDRLVERGVRVVRLSSSFRAPSPIQGCVNAAFAPVMEENREAGQAGYVPLEGELQPIEGQPAVIALPAPRPWGYRDITKTAIDKCLPDTVAAFIEWLVNSSGWKVRAPGDPDRLMPMEARHIAVLFRRFVNYGEDVTRPYIRALEARGVAHLLVGSKSFHQREEVETLRAACSAIEWPDDELAVFATLKGSLFAIPDNLLLRYRLEPEVKRKLHPLRPAEENLAEEFGIIREALDLLADLHRNRNRRPVADTLNRLLEATRAHVGFALRPGGHHVVGNVYRLVDLARIYEVGGGISFRGFVDELTDRADRVDSKEAPLVEESADGVRLMTVHTAKGLEFPVVILADLSANLASREADRYLDPARNLCAARLLWCAPWELIDHEAEEKAREHAEGVRVAYVAATRARDLLVVCAVGDREMDGWLQPLNKAIYPAMQAYRGGEPFPGCPSSGDRTVLATTDVRQGESSVRPGMHIPQQGLHKVVWWDPASLRLDIQARLGLSDHQMLKGDPGPSLAAHEAWRAAREAGIERGSAAGFEIVVPSEISEGPAGVEAPVHFESVQRLGDRPAGRRFGSLVHAILRDAGVDPSGVESLARAHARSFGAPEDEMRAAEEAARRALEHPLIARALSAAECHREWPLTLRLEGNRVLEGSIDLAFLEGDRWMLVDFKTDASVAPRRARYERQLGWYALALSKLTGKRVECWLLGV